MAVGQCRRATVPTDHSNRATRPANLRATTPPDPSNRVTPANLSALSK